MNSTCVCPAVLPKPDAVSKQLDEPKFSPLKPNFARFDPNDIRIHRRLFHPESSRYDDAVKQLYSKSAAQDATLAAIDRQINDAKAQDAKTIQLLTARIEPLMVKLSAAKESLRRAEQNFRNALKVESRMRRRSQVDDLRRADMFDAEPGTSPSDRAQVKVQSAKAAVARLTNQLGPLTAERRRLIAKRGEVPSHLNQLRNQYVGSFSQSSGTTGHLHGDGVTLEAGLRRTFHLLFSDAKRDALWLLDDLETRHLPAKAQSVSRSRAGVLQIAEDWKDEFPATVDERFEATIPHPDSIGMNRKPTRWYNIFGHGGNFVRKCVRNAYAHAREQSKQSVMASAKTVAESSHNKIVESLEVTESPQDQVVGWSGRFTFAAGDDIASGFDEMEHQTQSFIDHAVWLSRAVDFVLLAFCVLVCLRTYNYVFSRFAFATGNDVFASLGSPPIEASAGRIAAFADRYTLDKSVPEYQIAPTYRVLGAPPSTTLPQPTKRIFSRIRTWTYFMQRVRSHQKVGEFFIPIGGGASVCRMEPRGG